MLCEIKRVLGAVALLAVVSCQQGQLAGSNRGGSIAYRNYPDAVTNINAVDPAYRSYFARQHGANFSVAEQRKAYVAATQTARTSVQSDARHAATSSKRVATRRTTSKRTVSKQKVSRSSSGRRSSSKGIKSRKFPTKSRLLAVGAEGCHVV